MFRALVTLEGSVNALAPGYRVVESAQRLGGELMATELRPGSLMESARTELVRLVPLLERAPHHLDRLATLAERGELRAQVSLLGDAHDVGIITRLVNRVVLAVLASALGVVSAMLLGVDGGPALTPDLTMMEVLGYAGLVAGAVLVLRVVLAAVREEER